MAEVKITFSDAKEPELAHYIESLPCGMRALVLKMVLKEAFETGQLSRLVTTLLSYPRKEARVAQPPPAINPGKEVNVEPPPPPVITPVAEKREPVENRSSGTPDPEVIRRMAQLNRFG